MKRSLEVLRPGWRRAVADLWIGSLLIIQCSLQSWDILKEAWNGAADWDYSARRLRREFEHLPMPVKLAVVNSVVVVLLISIYPSWNVPPLYVPLTWMAAYCGSLIVTALLPRPRRLAAAHWLDAPRLAPRSPRPAPMQWRSSGQSMGSASALEQDSAYCAVSVLSGIASDPEVSDDDARFFHELNQRLDPNVRLSALAWRIRGDSHKLTDEPKQRE